MTGINYRMWPQAGEYLETSAIESYWPKYFSPRYCISPAINFQWFNERLPGNPMGTFRWGRRLQKNNGWLWDYGDLSFPGYPLFKGFPQAQIQIIDDHDITFTFTFDIIRGGIQKTGSGYYGGYIWPFIGGNSYYHDQEMPCWARPIVQNEAGFLTVSPVSLCDMWEDSHDPLL